jgi:Ca-activated chloride channel family protein
MSESQQAEANELVPNDKKGPQASEGDERLMVDITPKQQMSAEQLLRDPALNEMWMREVQKDPARFLEIKFYMQLEQQVGSKASASEVSP